MGVPLGVVTGYGITVVNLKVYEKNNVDASINKGVSYYFIIYLYIVAIYLLYSSTFIMDYYAYYSVHS